MALSIVMGIGRVLLIVVPIVVVLKVVGVV